MGGRPERQAKGKAQNDFEISQKIDSISFFEINDTRCEYRDLVVFSVSIPDILHDGLPYFNP